MIGCARLRRGPDITSGGALLQRNTRNAEPRAPDPENPGLRVRLEAVYGMLVLLGGAIITAYPIMSNTTDGRTRVPVEPGVRRARRQI